MKKSNAARLHAAPALPVPTAPPSGVVVTEGETVAEIAHGFRALEFRLWRGDVASPWTRAADEPGVLPNEFQPGRI